MKFFRKRKPHLDAEARQLSFVSPKWTRVEVSCLSSHPKVTYSIFSSLWASRGCAGAAQLLHTMGGRGGCLILEHQLYTQCTRHTHTHTQTHTHTTYRKIWSLWGHTSQIWCALSPYNTLMERTRLGFPGGGKGKSRNCPEETRLLFGPSWNSPKRGFCL